MFFYQNPSGDIFRSEVTNGERIRMKTEIYRVKNPSTSKSVIHPSDSGSATSSSSSSFARRINVSPTQQLDVTEPLTKPSDVTEPPTTSATSHSPRQSLDELIKVSVSFQRSYSVTYLHSKILDSRPLPCPIFLIFFLQPLGLVPPV